MAYQLPSRIAQAGIATALSLVIAACTAEISDGFNSAASGTSGAAGTGAGGTNAGGTNAGGTGTGAAPASSEFPCDVQKLLAQKCQACHRADPPGALLTSADFRRPSKADPQKTVGELAIERLSAAGPTRMPPAPLEAATAAETAALTSWVQSGAPSGTCQDGVAVAPNPYDTPLVCSSMTSWTGGNEESPLMRPGGACIKCHDREGEGPRLAIAGTLYPTAHEPDDCNGVARAAGAKIVVTDANGTSHTLDVNGAGNFFLETESFAFPYQAKVTYQGRERVMLEAQDNGDCNDCHSQDGRENAPGRLFLP
jgi:mono/diheme cytochrome c family protein